ncbi:MAG: energy transducer TonB [Pseudomonadota bacterium]|nr:energy transducer TonB [Pseudomonadota bacterium]
MSLRYPVAVLAGISAALALFWLMQVLIIGRGADIARTDTLPLVEFVRLKHEAETRTRERVLPKQPPEPEHLPRPRLDIDYDINTVMPTPQFSMELDLALDLTGGAYLGPVVSGESDRDFMPVSRIPPQYPYQATRRKIEGWVRVSFTVTETGTVEDVVLLESEPGGIFDRAAIRAVSRWKFKPRVVAGKPVSTRAEQRVEFKLDD